MALQYEGQDFYRGIGGATASNLQKNSLGEMLRFLGDSDLRSHNLAILYLRENDSALNELIKYLEEKQKALNSGMVMLETRQMTARSSTVDLAHRHISGLRESRTLHANAYRDIERYLREWRLLEN